MELTKKQIRFLRVKNSPKNDAWVTANGSVVWSTDGHHLYVIGERGHLYYGDLSIPCGRLTGASLQYVSPADPSRYRDPTDLVHSFGYNFPKMLYNSNVIDTLKTYIKWSNQMGVLSRENSYDVTLSFHSPITAGIQPPILVPMGTMNVPGNVEKILPARPVQKIMNNMQLRCIISAGVCSRDPVYFFGVVDSMQAIAIVSPYK